MQLNRVRAEARKLQLAERQGVAQLLFRQRKRAGQRPRAPRSTAHAVVCADARGQRRVDRSSHPCAEVTPQHIHIGAAQLESEPRRAAVRRFLWSVVQRFAARDVCERETPHCFTAPLPLSLLRKALHNLKRERRRREHQAIIFISWCVEIIAHPLSGPIDANDGELLLQACRSAHRWSRQLARSDASRHPNQDGADFAVRRDVSGSVLSTFDGVGEGDICVSVEQQLQRVGTPLLRREVQRRAARVVALVHRRARIEERCADVDVSRICRVVQRRVSLPPLAVVHGARKRGVCSQPHAHCRVVAAPARSEHVGVAR